MKVKCIDTKDIMGLTLNKIYDVVSAGQGFYILVNDAQETLRYYKERFVPASGSDIADIIPVNTSKILDSGARRSFDTGAVRDIAEGKGRCDLLPLDVIALLIEDTSVSPINDYIRYGDANGLLTAIKNFAKFDHKSWGNVYTAILEAAKQYEDGAKKYDERNWEKGISVHCYIDSGVRHYLKYLRGDTDEPHDRAFVWNMLGAIWTHNNMPELIDLPFKKDVTK